MIHGIRTVQFATFASCALWVSCKPQAPDPAQLTAVDQLISTTDAAMLTLNELDRGRYLRSDSLFVQQRVGFVERFRDTLDPRSAQALGDQFIALRASHEMGADHERLLDEIGTTSERLRTLRNDLANGAIKVHDAAPIIASEQKRHTLLIDAVHRVMDNYRVLQHAWDRRDTVAMLLSDTNTPALP